MPPRSPQIDVLKGLAAISIIILHSVSNQTKYSILAPYHIWQALPVFIILLGYNSSNSYMRSNIQTLRQCFSTIPRRLNTLFWPYTAFIVVEFFGLSFLKGYFVNPLTLYLFGGIGIGSFFTPVAVQLFLILPFIYMLSMKNRYLPIIVALAVGIAFDVFADYTKMDVNLYRLIGTRYMFAMALGIYLARNHISDRALLAAGVIGVAWIAIISAYPRFYLTYPDWHLFSPPTLLWGLFIVALGLRYLPDIPILSITGKASYHIFLVQMLYFGVVGIERFTSLFIIAVNVLICVVSGLTFYFGHNYLSQKWTNTYSFQPH